MTILCILNTQGYVNQRRNFKLASSEYFSICNCIKCIFNILQLDDAALQLYKDGDYGAYLDLEASISEQQEEFEGFQSK